MKELKLNEKLAICYTCCGPTFRESAIDKLKNEYFDHDNIYYCILTDDKSCFEGIERKNLIVNELKDFYPEFPKLEKNEFFLESVSKNDYSTKFCDTNYLFPFSTYRFNILQAIRLGIKNVALLCTDTSINFQVIDDNFFDHVNFIHTTANWDANVSTMNMHKVVNRLNEKFNLVTDETVRVLDAAGRLFVPDSFEKLKTLFYVWNDVIEYLYDENLIDYYKGSYVINDEYILAPIYNALNLNKMRDTHPGIKYSVFDVKHDVGKERYWRTSGRDGLHEHKIYEEFLKLNNL